jgi:hypothetical protein
MLRITGNFHVANFICSKFAPEEIKEEQVQKWLNFVSREKQCTSIEEFDLECQKINWELQVKTYLTGYVPSLCDFFYYEYLKSKLKIF